MTVTSPPSDAASELAAKHGLAPSSARPSLPTYARQLWDRRHFIATFSRSRMMAQYSRTHLGHVWQVLTPLFNAAVYGVMFGLILGARADVENYIGYLVTGVFVFTFAQRSVNSGARAISGNLSLIRALHFPRASLPFASTLVELQQLLVSMAVLCFIVVITGEPVSVAWLMVVPALLLMTLFNIGLSLAIARVGAFAQDITQLLPFTTRTWLYASGVFFSIPERVFEAPQVPNWVAQVLMANPASVYIELVRDALMASYPGPDDPIAWSSGMTWILGAAWAVVALVAGFWYFWSAEEKYGRG